MSSLNASSFVSPPPSPPTLSHSLNSRGELGMFVNPYGCPCQTCRDYLAERSAPDLPEDSTERPATPPAAELPPLRSTFVPPSLLRARGTGAASGGVFPAPSLVRYVSLGGAFPSPPALARTVTGLGYAPASVSETDEAPLPAPRVSTDVNALMDGLRGLRAELQLLQDDVYAGETRSHDEMAAQDAEWNDLDRKIHAIEQCMMSFGAIFRTR
jgi:hypothetical protein